MSSLSKLGVTFIPTADQSIYYYTAARPRVGLTSAGGEEGANISYRVYRTQAGAFYATLMLAATAGVTQATAKAAAKAAGISSNAELTPLQLIASEMTVGLPGIFEATNTAAINNDCLSIVGISLQDKANIQLLQALLENHQADAPLLISYKQDYLYQLELSEFEMEINWSKVYNYLKTSVGFNAIIFSVNVTKIAEDIIQNKSINIVIKGRNPDSNAYFQQAALEMANVLLTEFFRLQVSSPKNNDEDSKPVLGFSLKRVSIKDFQQRRLTASMTERTVVRRSIFPQATFQQFIADAPYDPQAIISNIDLKNSFFDQRKVSFYLIDKDLNPVIESVNIDVNYGNDLVPLSFKSGDTGSQNFAAPIQYQDKQDKQIDWNVSYNCQIALKEAVAGVVTVAAAPATTTSRQVFLDTAALLGQYTFEIKEAVGFHWDWYSEVRITLRGTNPNASQTEQFQQTFTLTEAKPKEQWPVILPNLHQFQFTATFDYRPANNSAHLPDSVERPVSQKIIAFKAIHPQRQIQIHNNYDWNEVKEVKVSLKFEYTTGEWLYQTITLSAAEPQVVAFSADQPHPDFESVSYQIIQKNQDGSTLILPQPRAYYNTDQNEINLPE